MLRIIFLCVTVFILAAAINAQSSFGVNAPSTIMYTCEEFSARVDTIYNIAKSSGKRIFVIFHAGRGESETVNFRRLSYVRDFLKINKLWKELNVVYARGDKSSEKSVIAFYVDGNLIEQMSAPYNMTPCMDCCEAKYYTPQSLLKPINFKSVRAKENRRIYSSP